MSFVIQRCQLNGPNDVGVDYWLVLLVKQYDFTLEVVNFSKFNQLA